MSVIMQAFAALLLTLFTIVWVIYASVLLLAAYAYMAWMRVKAWVIQKI